ncbi:MAG TPA: hypothetical protein VMU76_11770 [Acidimicrobiales bacterium]|nr:hypothetical protein [Acidimicrobiales bacterium]
MKPARLQRTILVDDVALCFPDLDIREEALPGYLAGNALRVLGRPAAWAESVPPAGGGR